MMHLEVHVREANRKFLHLVFSAASVQEQDSIILDCHQQEVLGCWKEIDCSFVFMRQTDVSVVEL